MEVSYNPHVPMDPRIKLRGQSYDRFQLLGPLTDERIEHYEAAGFYGSMRMAAARARIAERKRKAEMAKIMRKTLSSDDIVKLYNI